MYTKLTGKMLVTIELVNVNIPGGPVYGPGMGVSSYIIIIVRSALLNFRFETFGKFPEETVIVYGLVNSCVVYDP